jgi:Mechanosensitive ion channel, beta-domain
MTRSRLIIVLMPSVLFVVVLTAGLSAEVSPVASDLPSNQQVLAFLTESIDWYRHRAVERQIATDPVDLVYLEDNRQLAGQIVKLSFDFARADASLAVASPANNQKGSTAAASASSPDMAQLFQMEENVAAAAQRASQEIEAIKQKLPAARGAERRKLQAALDTAQSRLDVLQTGSATLRQLTDFMRRFGDHETGDLPSSIDGLARTVPDVIGSAAGESQRQSSDFAPVGKLQGSGILGLISEVSALGRKLSILDDEMRLTDILRQSSDNLRLPLIASINKRHLPLGAQNDLQASDLSVLQQEKAQLDELAALVKALSPAIVALDKQNVLFAAYASHLKSWRAAVLSEDKKAWKGLTLRLVSAAVVIGALIVITTLARRFTDTHVRDAERRHVFRVFERIGLGFTIALVVAFSFASDLTSLATFLGLLTAGLAVALQSVILSALGYFILVGRRGIRIGDRVQISGVTGDVTDIGWLQFQLREIDNKTQQPTGHVVTFSNSFVLASPATGLSKFDQEDTKQSQLDVTGQRSRS